MIDTNKRKDSSILSYIRNAHTQAEMGLVKGGVWTPRDCQSLQHCTDVVMTKFTLNLALGPKSDSIHSERQCQEI